MLRAYEDDVGDASPSNASDDASPQPAVSRPEAATPQIRDAMLAAIPGLRAFALSLTRNSEQADDLVQDAIVRAWAAIDRFQPGTNLNAWLFTILRNCFLTQRRYSRRYVEDPDSAYAAGLRTPPDQNAKCDVQDMLRALGMLSVDQRTALLLVAAQGLSYEDAAQVCGVCTGTVKSRVNRARARLAQLLAIEDAEDLGADQVTQAALQGAF